VFDASGLESTGSTVSYLRASGLFEPGCREKKLIGLAAEPVSGTYAQTGLCQGRG